MASLSAVGAFIAKYKWWFIGFVALVGLYFLLAYLFGWWPFNEAAASAAAPVVVTTTPTATPAARLGRTFF